MCSSHQISGNINVNLFFTGVQRLKKEPMMKSLLPGENDIVVENKLEVWVYVSGRRAGQGRARQGKFIIYLSRDAHLDTV